MKDKYFSFLFKKVDASTLGLFRIAFGAFMFYQMIYYLNIDYTYQLMSGPEVLFKYPYLEFLTPFSDSILKVILFGLIISTIFITIGFLYRYAMIYFFLGFSYFTFVDTTIFNNHLYLFALIAFIMIFMKADTKFSLNLKKTKKSSTVPNWNIRLIQFLVVITYFFGAVSKLSSGDWMDGSIATIMVQQAKDSFLQKIFSENLLVNLIAYGGFLFDLSIGFLLLYKPTRIIAVGLLLFFNLTNGGILFDDIGIFPYFMIFSTIIFFAPESIKKLFSKFTQTNSASRNKKKKKANTISKSTVSTISNNWTKSQIITAALISCFVIFHILFPLRWIPLTDNPEWTGIGSRFTWRMKMQIRKLEDIKFSIVDPSTGSAQEIQHTSFLSSNQHKNMINDPYAVIQFAKYLKQDIIKRSSIKDPEIRAEIMISLNGRTPQLMFNPNIDLCSIDIKSLDQSGWLIPLKEKK